MERLSAWFAIGNAGSSKIEDQLQSLGDNFVWIEAGSRARNGLRAGARSTRSLVLNDAYAIVEQVPLIKSMSPNVDGHIQVVAVPACVLGQTVVENLFGIDDPTGKTIRLQSLPCKGMLGMLAGVLSSAVVEQLFESPQPS